MPEYLGDRATVFPSNTQSIMHWSTLFEQRKREKEARAQRAAEMDENRRIALSKYIGDKVSKPEFHQAFNYQDVVDAGIENIYKQATDQQLKKVPWGEIYSSAVTGIGDVLSQATKAKTLRENLEKGVADVIKSDPYVDAGALTDLALADATYDESGKRRDLKDVDLNKNWVDGAYKNHADKLYSSESYKKAMDEFFKRQELSDVNDPQVVNEDSGDLIRQGYKGKLPPIARVVTGADGLPVVRKNGSPEVEINRFEYYKLPGESKDFTDEHGQKIKVLDKESFDQFYNGPMRSMIDRRVQSQLDEINKGRKEGDTFGKDSDIADMFRRQAGYDLLKREVDDRYKFTNPAYDGFRIKEQIRNRKLREASLAIQRARLNETKRKNKRAEKKEDGEHAPTESLMDKYDKKFGEEVKSEETGVVSRMIDVRKIDKEDYDIITGTKSKTGGNDLTATLLGTPSEESPVNPVKFGDNDYFIIDDQGDWWGKDGKGEWKRIDFESAYNRQTKNINPIKKEVGGEKSQGLRDRLRSRISGFSGAGKEKKEETPENNFKGTSKKMY